jgi:hypothetical protein
VIFKHSFCIINLLIFFPSIENQLDSDNEQQEEKKKAEEEAEK